MPPLRCAFFDVDGTIIARDSFRTLVLRLLGAQPWRIVQLPLVLPIFLLTALCARDRRWTKSIILWSLTWGLSRRVAVRLIREIMQNEWHRLWFEEATACFEHLRTHERCHLVFVSASGQLWLRHLLNTMDNGQPKTIIGSRLGFWFLGGVVYKSPNCFGTEKLVRIRERLGESIEWHMGYSDHAVDIPMLTPCHTRIVISPTARNLARFTQTFKNSFRVERWHAQIDSERSSPR